MKVKEFKKYGKLELFGRLDKLRLKTAQQIESGVPQYKILPIMREHEKLKRYLYKCRLCADATIKTYEQDGEEIDYLVADCGKKCQYHEYFYNKALGKEDKTDELMASLLKKLRRVGI
jgi:hypothetical protein